MENDPMESNDLIESNQEDNELIENDQEDNEMTGIDEEDNDLIGIDEGDNDLIGIDEGESEPNHSDETNPTDLDELDNEAITILVPSGISGPEEISEWFTSFNVLNAQKFLAQKVLGTSSDSEIDIALKFLKFVERGFTDTCCGEGPILSKINESRRRTKRILRNITRFLMISDDGTYSGEVPPDLGNEGLNRLATMITALERRMNQRFTQMNRRMNQRFTRIDRRFTRIDRRFTRIDRKLIRMDRKLDSIRSAQANQFKIQGGESGSDLAYDEIANKDGKFPSELNMEPVCSLHQIDRFNGTVLNTYLRFYDLPIRGTVPQRKNRLKYWIGVPHAQIIKEEFGIDR